MEPLEQRLLLSADWPHEDDIPCDVADELVIGPGDTLSGNRTVVGDVLNQGVLSPGNSPGIINIDGDLVIDGSDGGVIDPPSDQTAGGTLRIEIGGMDAGDDDGDGYGYDQVNVTGNVILGGTLVIDLINEFQPQVGWTFDILTAGNLSGAFDDAKGLFGFGDGSSYFEIKVVDNDATPSETDKIVQLEVKEAPGAGKIISRTPAVNDLLGRYFSDYFTFDGSVALSGELAVSDFVTLAGSFEFGVNLLQDVTVATGLSSNLDGPTKALVHGQIAALTALYPGLSLSDDLQTLSGVPVTTLEIGGSDIQAFAGTNGPYWTDLDGDGNVGWSFNTGNGDDASRTITSGSVTIDSVLYDTTNPILPPNTVVTLGAGEGVLAFGSVADGTDVQYGDIHNVGTVDADETAELSENATGLAITNVDFGYVAMLALPVLPLSSQFLHALKVTSSQVGLVGVEQVKLEAQNVLVEVNTGPTWTTAGAFGAGPAVVDFAASFPAGYEVGTGTVPVYLDYDGNERIGASVDHALLSIGDNDGKFVYLSGNLSFEKGPTSNVRIATGLSTNLDPVTATFVKTQFALRTLLGSNAKLSDDLQTIDDVQVSALQIGGSDIQVFVGTNGPYWTDLDGDGNVGWSFNTGNGDDASRTINSVTGTSDYTVGQVLGPNTVVTLGPGVTLTVGRVPLEDENGQPILDNGQPVLSDGFVYGDIDNIGVVDPDETGELSETATGLAITNVDFGYVAMTPTLRLPLLKSQTFTGFKLTASKVGLVGIEQVVLEAQNVLVEVNTGPTWTAFGVRGDGPAVVDFESSFPAEGTGEDTDGDGLFEEPSGYQVRTGTTSEPIYVDYDGNERIGASVDHALLSIGDNDGKFVYLSGNLSFEKGPTSNVRIATGIATDIPDLLKDAISLEFSLRTLLGSNATLSEDLQTINDVQVSALQIGGSDIQAFVGLDGPYWTDLDGDGNVGWAFHTGNGDDASRTINSGSVTIDVEGVPTFFSSDSDNNILPRNRVVTLPDGDVIEVDGVKYGDVQNIGTVDADETAELSEKATGVAITNVDFGYVAMTPTLKLPMLKSQTFTALKLTATQVALVGIDEVQLSANNVSVNVNVGPKWTGTASNMGPAVIKFADSFPATGSGPVGYEVRTGTTSEPVYIDFNAKRIGASIGQATLRISEFVHITGSIAFEQGPAQKVKVAGGLLSDLGEDAGDFLTEHGLPSDLVDSFPALGGSTTQLGVMTIGASNVHAFVGMDGPYWTDLDGDRNIGWTLPDDGTFHEPVTIGGKDYAAGESTTGITLTAADPVVTVNNVKRGDTTVDGVQYGDLNRDGEVDADETAELNEEAVGLVINDFDFGMAIMKPKNPYDFSKYFSLKASADSIELVGIKDVTVAAKKILVEVNLSSPSVYGVPLFPVVDFAGTTQFASEQYALFDTDGDHTVTVGELRALTGQASYADLYSESDEADDPLDIDAVVDALDALGNGNGVLEISEVQAVLLDVSLAETADADGDGFIEEFQSEQAALFDTDRDGVIRLGELAAMPGASVFTMLSAADPSDTTPVDHETLVEILDTDRSGTIEIAEVLALTGGAESAVALYDVDGDGKIEPAGFEVNTGGEPVYLSMDSSVIRAQGFLEIDLFGVLILNGSIAFELGPTQEVTLTDDGDPDTPPVTKTVTTMTVGAANVTAFVGYHGPYWTDLDGDHEPSWSDADGNPRTQAEADTNGNYRVDANETAELNEDAIGLHITDLDLGLMIMASTALDDLGVYLAGDFRVRDFGFVGIDQVQATGTFDIALNMGIGMEIAEGNPPVVDFLASFPETAGFEVNTGNPDSPVLLDFDQFLISFQLGGSVTIYTDDQQENPVFRLNGLALFETNETGLSLFVAAGLEFGPDIDSGDKFFDMNALGGLVINDEGIAADIDVSVAIGDALGSSMSVGASLSARVIFNTTGSDQSITIPAKYVQFLEGTVDLAEFESIEKNGGDVSALNSLTRDLDADPRFDVHHGDPGFEDGSATFTISGIAPTLAELFPDAELEDKSTPLSAPGPYFAVAIDAELRINDNWNLDGRFGLIVADAGFQMSAEANLNLGPLEVYVNTYIAIFKEDDPSTPGDDRGLIVDAEASLDCDLFSILEVEVDGRLQINTTDVDATSSNGNEIAANSFYLDVSGSLDLLGVLTIEGQVIVDVDQNDWTIEVPYASVDFFGIGSLNVNGAISSEGEFQLHVDGAVNIGVAGCGLFGTGSLDVSRLDDNGFGLGGDGNFQLHVSGYFDVSVQLFGVTLAGAHLAGSYDQASGHISVVASVDILWWTYSFRFSVGYLTTPPPVYLAGNFDDTTGTDFAGGDLYLNMGPRASLRNLSIGEKNEFFTVEYVGPSEGGGYTVRVHGMGKKATYQGVTKIIADGGDGADYLHIMADVPVPVEFRGGAGTDCLMMAGDDSPNDLRVTMDDENVVWVSSYSNNSETGSVKLASVEAVSLVGDEGADQFSVSGELDLGGVTTGVTVDLGSLTGESGQLPDGEVDTVALTLGPGADDFELEPTDTGFQGTWKSHFTLDVQGAYASDQDKVDVSAGSGDDRVLVFFDPEQYGTSPAQDGPVSPGHVQDFHFLKDQDSSQFGPTYSFAEIEDLIFEKVRLVDTLVDVVNPGDGLTSLREAIQWADANPGADNIRFAPELAGGTITLAQGELRITSDVDLWGAGVTIDAANAGTVLHVFAAATDATIRDLTITGGYGCGIVNRGTLHVVNSMISNNVAYGGGGIFNTGTLDVINSTIADNRANLLDVSPYGGGGIWVESGSVTVSGSTIFSNSTIGHGGGIFVSFGSVTVRNSTISSNSSDRHAGGIYVSTQGDVTVVNSTISGNTANWSGGGILQYGTLSVLNSTIAENTAFDGAGVWTVSGVTTLHNTIVAKNNRLDTTADDLFGIAVHADSSYNLVGVASEPSRTVLASGVGNIVGVDALLAPLGDYGGPTQTHSLLPGSPAINAGDPDFDPNAFDPPLLTDQRGSGFPRVFDAAVDIGAFEVENHPPVLTTNKGITLDEGAAEVIDNTELLVSDLYDPGQTLTYTIQTSVTHGTLARAGDTLGEGGSFTQKNIDAGELSYTHDGGEGRADSFVFSVQDGYGGTIEDITFEVTIDPVNDPPANAVPAPQITAENMVLVFSAAMGNGVSIADVDVGAGSVQVELSVLDGTLTLAHTTGLAFVTGDGTGDPSMRFTGAIADVNTALEGMSYHPDAGFTGTDTLGITSDDQGNSGKGGPLGDTDTVAIWVRPLEVDTTADVSDGDFSEGKLSLREAIELANAIPGADTILFAPELTGETIELSLGQLVITSNLDLVGPGVTIRAAANNRVLYVASVVTDATIGGLTITGGSTAGSGAGILNYGRLAVANSTIADNVSRYTGGGIYNEGTLWVINSTLSGNRTERGSYSGGGIYNRAGTLWVVNSTISGNSAAALGGGIYNYPSGVLSVSNSTIVGNTADAYDVYGKVGGGIANAGSTTLHNTIVAGNVYGTARLADDFWGYDVDSGSSCNLIGDANSSGGLVDGVNGNIVGNDGEGTIELATVLSPLGDYGGPTKTHALLPYSPAINAGSDALRPVDLNGVPLEFDQRGSGFARIFDAAVDIGAFEVQNQPPVLTTNAGITLGEGGTEVIDNTKLLVSDLYHPGQTLTYTIQTSVTHGTLALVGVGELDAGHSFTQADVDTGTLSYTHDGSEAGLDSFVFSVSDGNGGTVADTTFGITIDNVAPTARVEGPLNGVPGQLRTFTLFATDPSWADQAEGFTYQIDWNGDGSEIQTVTGASGTEVSHTFGAVGTFPVKVTATDKDGGVSQPASLDLPITSITVQGDDVAVGGTSIQLDPAETEQVRIIVDGADPETFAVLGRILAYGSDGGSDNLQVNGTAGNDAMTKAAGQITWGDALPTIYYDGIEVFTFDGMEGDDTYTVNFAHLVETVNVYDTGSSESDSLVANGTDGYNYFKKDTKVVWSDEVSQEILQTLAYSGVENLSLVGGTGTNDIIDPDTGTSGVLNTRIISGPGTNTILITSTAGNGVVIDTAGTTDITINLGELAAPVTVTSQAGEPPHSVTVVGTAGPDDVAVSGTTVQTATGETINLDTPVETLAVQGGDGNDQISVAATTSVAAITLDGGGGDNTFTLVDLGSSASPPESLTINGGTGEGNNQVVVEGAPPPNVAMQRVAPFVGALTAPLDPRVVGSEITASVNFTDSDTDETHTATWNWGDGSAPVTEPTVPGIVVGNHVYSAASVYTVNVTVADNNGGSTTRTFRYIVVYDPNAGFVTGGGWIDSPAGAYFPDPNLTGKANFGFVSKYQQGTTVPTGQTEFHLKVANLKFHTTSYDWLVMGGAIAQYKGEGTINGSGDYGFLITASDGQRDGGGGVDQFRIKIWDKATGVLVYDNQMDAADDAPPTTSLGGGSIVIHDEAAALRTAQVASGQMAQAMLSENMLGPTVEEAISYWAGQGLAADRVESLRQLEVEMADLTGSLLGIASSSNLVWIDRDAAGYGWRVDSIGTASSLGDGMDLLSVVVHEFGHVLGLDHDDPYPVMAATLAPGVRTVSTPASPWEPQFVFVSLDRRVGRSHLATPFPSVFDPLWREERDTKWASSVDSPAVRARDEFFAAIALQPRRSVATKVESRRPTYDDHRSEVADPLDDLLTGAMADGDPSDGTQEGLLDEDVLEMLVDAQTPS